MTPTTFAIFGMSATRGMLATVFRVVFFEVRSLGVLVFYPQDLRVQIP